MTTLFDSLPEGHPPENRAMFESKLIANASEESRVELTMRNMREAFLYVKKCCKAKIADSEIVSLCYTTLYRNTKRFKPGGLRFFAFTKVALRGAISDYWTATQVVRNARQCSESEMYRSMGAKPDQMEGHDDEIYCAGLHAEQPTFEGGLVIQTVEPEFNLIHLRERYGMVKTIMERKLTDQERMIIDLVYTSGFTFEQIGDLLGVTGSAAENTHSTAMKKIRRELRLSGQLL